MDSGGAFVRSRSARRDLSKGERAMALAFLYPEPAKLKRKGTGSLATKEQGFSAALLSNARSILHHSVELAEQVRDGDISLDDAGTARATGHRRRAQSVLAPPVAQPSRRRS